MALFQRGVRHNRTPIMEEVMLRCDKCLERVPADNSVITFDHLRGQGLSDDIMDRHLLPVESSTPCEGSPSRYQYLEGWPRAKGREYFTHMEEAARRAFREMCSMGSGAL